MKKIVVTGGSGFIGSNLIDLLLKKKYFVINIDKSSYSANPFNVRKFKKKKNYIFFKLDINNRKKVLNILKKYKPIGIFNLAAETHVDRSIDNPKNFITSNVLGVYHLMEAVRDSYRSTKKKIKLLHVSKLEPISL
jgi:dTDP-glucose 4,6-dehydratase